MQIIEVAESIAVVGIELRTSNERAFEDIPAHWERFHRSGGLAAIPGRLGDDVLAVYMNFEHAGVDNLGLYSFIIGAAVAGTAPAPPDMMSIVITGSR